MTTLEEELEEKIEELKDFWGESLREDLDLRREECRYAIEDLKEELKDDLKDIRLDHKMKLKEELKELRENWIDTG